MRFYDIVITNSDGSNFRTFTSHPNGVNQPPDGGALKIEFQLMAAGFGLPGGQGQSASWVRIWGIPLSEIGQSVNFFGKDISIYGGMGKGLPLAKPAQSGLLVSGTIQRPFGNWIDTNQVLEFMIVAGSPSAGVSAAQNIVINWKAGTQLSQAVQNTLKTTFPNTTVTLNIANSLVLPSDVQHVSANLDDFTSWVQQISQQIVNYNATFGPWGAGDIATVASGDEALRYKGVQIQLSGSTFRVYDGTAPSSPKVIDPTDLVGQPTWIGPFLIQVTLVMRGDVKVGDFIQLPSGLTTQSSASAPAGGPATPAMQQRQSVSFQGTFQIQDLVQHVGNYKDGSALSWVTVLTCAQSPTNSAGQGQLPTSSSPAPTVSVVGTPNGDVTFSDLDIQDRPASGSDAGLTGYAAPSNGLTTGNGPTQIPSGATAADSGLTQTAPPPSLGQSITVGSGAP